jgi:cold shock CspA family protein
MPKSQASFTKKEKEKKKLQKRQEKEERKKERQANSSKGKSLEDMMAYIDENGNITSTPPDPTKKKTIKTDDILIGARNRDDESSVNAFRTGKITFFNTSKGYGFIKDSDSQESIFVHQNALSTVVKENDTVTFQTERGPKGLSAIHVKKV